MRPKRPNTDELFIRAAAQEEKRNFRSAFRLYLAVANAGDSGCQVKVGGVSVGAGLIGGFSRGVIATNYTKPLQLGKFWEFGPTDFVLYAAGQVCK